MSKRVSLTLLLVLVLIAANLGYSQTGNQTATVAANTAAGSWNPIPQNSSIQDVVGTEPGDSTLNRLGYAIACTFDSGHLKVWCSGSGDHGDQYWHLFYWDLPTNNWTDLCPGPTKGTASTSTPCSDDGHPVGEVASVASWTGNSTSSGSVSNFTFDSTTILCTGQTFDITWSGGTYTSVAINNKGWNCVTNSATQTFTIKGSRLGGVDGTNDLVVTTNTNLNNPPTHGYEFINVDSVTGIVYFKTIGGISGSGTLKLYKYDPTVVNEHMELVSSINPIYEGQNATTWWTGPVKGGNPVGSLMVNNCTNAANGEVLMYNPYSNAWFADILGFAGGAPSTYQCVASYSRAYNAAVFGGGNDTPRKMWRLNMDQSVTALPDTTFGVGVQQYNMVADPVTGNMLYLGEVAPRDLTTSGAGSVSLTSAEGGFTADMVGQTFTIYNDSCGVNFVTGNYTVASRINTNTITLTTSPTPSGAGSGGCGHAQLPDFWELDPSGSGAYTRKSVSNPPPSDICIAGRPWDDGCVSVPLDVYGGVAYIGQHLGNPISVWFYKNHGLDTHATQCAASTTVRCWNFDTDGDLQYGCQLNYGTCANGNDATLISRTTIDHAVFAEGDGSMHMSIPNTHVNASAAADWYGNFSTDLSALYGCLGDGCTTEYDFYIGWRQRFSSTYLSNKWAGGEGWKIGGWGTGDTTAPTHTTSCTTTDIVFLNGYYNDFPNAEHSCVGSSSHPYPYNSFELNVPYSCVGVGCTADLYEENARPAPGCLYSQVHLAQQFPPTGNCFPFTPDTWIAWQYRVHLGKRGAGGLINTFTKSGTAPSGSGSVTNIATDSQIGYGTGAKFDVSWSGGVYTVTLHDTNLTTGTRGFSYGIPGTLCQLTILGTQFGGISPDNDLTINVTGALFNVEGAPPNDEWVNSYVEMWAAADGSPYWNPIYSFGPFGWSAGNLGERIGKFWLLSYDTGRSDTKPQADVWYDDPIIANARFNAPVASTAPPTQNNILSKTGTTTVVINGSITYSLNLGNSGSATSDTTLTVADQMPTGVAATTCTGSTNVASVSCTNLNTPGALVVATVHLTTGMAASSSTGTSVFTISATAPSTGGTIINYASIDPTGGSSPATPGISCSTGSCGSLNTTVTAPSTTAGRRRAKRP